ncbi:uncharacterized protein LACBIDRAFT_293900 [Laccaria bicolor S238N-H82]|uniref:Predicted protein n=1 Tax=Laccaria bicolor (strain S238N-H82 / ATCC MYA-4686) TaxID=486041 RepID=B0D7K1_LACBS|nr:uncharacterized protein LACBIDRAFT_293900 [Laccaria bicolor S238N-H82]EDR09413.1 predicted protein [Laccaria bicolor S238N-H82]|eukprot:XP_001879762.1 predicted protein [Laccaria bicolor S238N-H82]
MEKFRANFAASRHVNPPGAEPRLSEEQVWKGLELKARQPENFVAVISSCDVLSDTGTKVTREVYFGNNPPMKEEVELHHGTIAYFDAEAAGIRITNVLSYDANNELVLTFSYAGGIPGFTPVGELHPSPHELNRAVGVGVDLTIERIRELVKEGELVV